MKELVILGMLVLVTSFAQTLSSERWDWTLPASLVMKRGVPQTYRFTCDYYYLDTKGNLGRRERVSALYLRDLPEDRVRWTDIALAESNDSSDNFSPARKRDFMEDFSYTRASLKDMLKSDEHFLLRIAGFAAAGDAGKAGGEGARRRTCTQVGRGGEAVVARVADPSALSLQHAELDQFADPGGPGWGTVPEGSTLGLFRWRIGP